jgi:hypothetical protein
VKTSFTCQSLNWLQVHDFFWGVHNFFAFEFFTVIMLLRTFAQRCKRLTPLFAAPAALLLLQGQAKAFLTYNIYESAGNVVVQTSGSLDFTGATLTGSTACGYNGGIAASEAGICTGPDVASPYYNISGPKSFNGTAIIYPASSVSGIFTGLAGVLGIIIIDSAYVWNTPIVSSATFNGKTLAGIGFTTTGLIGTWSLTGTSETIQVIVGPPTAAAPGPLPLFGAAAAFGWSRRLRKRMATPLITSPQA